MNTPTVRDVAIDLAELLSANVNAALKLAEEIAEQHGDDFADECKALAMVYTLAEVNTLAI